MNLHQLEMELHDMMDGLQDFATNEAPGIIGDMAVEFYKEGFENEGFTDVSLERWKEVKRRENPTRPDRIAARAKILTGTTNLRRSIKPYVSAGEVTIRSEAFSKNGFNYAPVHNFGTEKIPQREFVGESETLNEKILQRMKEKAAEILKNK